MILIQLGLLINILVAGYFGIILLYKKMHTKIYGVDSTSRQILFSLYLAIANNRNTALLNLISN
jgi:hypothetical protein